MNYGLGSKSYWLFEAMKLAAKTNNPRTVREWANGYGLSTVTVYRIASDERLKAAIRNHQAEATGTIPTAIEKLRGNKYATIGSRILRRAGLLNAEALSYRITKEQIILERA